MCTPWMNEYNWILVCFVGIEYDSVLGRVRVDSLQRPLKNNETKILKNSNNKKKNNNNKTNNN